MRATDEPGGASAERRWTPRRALVFALAAGSGALGLLSVPGLGTDPLAALAWLALAAAAAGHAAGAARIPLLPYGLAIPGIWASVLLVASLGTARPVPEPLWAMAAVAGLFGLGWGSGARLGRPVAGAGIWLFVALLLAGGPVQGGLSRGPSWAEHHPRLALALLEASPIVLVLECAGLDWTHAQPDLYRLSGVDWFPRGPYRGALAGPAALVLGCTLGAFLGRRPRRRAHA